MQKVQSTAIGQTYGVKQNNFKIFHYHVFYTLNNSRGDEYMYYLMIKKHNKTGLKYLCQTRRKDPYLYSGSGSYWKMHLESHGYDISTEILGTYENKKTLNEAGVYYSNLFNVVDSEGWANLRVENGDGGDTSKTDGYINGMKNRRSYSGTDNPNYGKVGSWAGKIGPQLNKTWYNDGTKELLTHKRPDGWINGRLTFTCAHCGKVTNIVNYKRWHNDNCKNRK